ncbi:MAG TPA: rhomboid family intramembrane serine protease [Acetobacteraceae bacterium]
MRPLSVLAPNPPAPATWLLLALNVAAFLAIAAATGTLTLSVPAAVRFGALYPGALNRRDLLGGQWRLVASGFLHFSPMHLLFNMVCLASWGTAVERRIGTAWFVLLYGTSLVAGSLVASAEPHGVTAGASGAIAGLLGALLYLSLRRKVEMPLATIAATVALNVAFSAGVPSISWRAHLGGFIAGILACLVLEVAAWVSGWMLRCRFPEWIKLDLMLVPALAALSFPVNPAVLGASLVLYVIVVVKAADLALCRQHGLAAVAGAAVLAQAALLARAGAGLGTAGVQAAGVALAIIVLAHLRPLLRGLHDRSFVPAALQAERRRVRGL